MGLVSSIGLMARLARWRCDIWLPDYLRRRMKAPARRDDLRPLDVIVVVVDHFEPSRRDGAAGVQKVRSWCDRYAEVASRHRDSDGVMPQHGWFYRYDYPNLECIQILSEYVFRGFGEIDFHLHHGHDSSESFEQKIRDGVRWFNQVGAMITAEAEPKRRFGYIAGNWALDNGRRNPAMSGVNNELEILGRNGCFADFTFPAFGMNSQPRMANSIYYATDTPEPKSYDRGTPARKGQQGTGDLMLITGPLYVDWLRGQIEYAALETFAPYHSQRADYWLRAGVHVADQPEWVFVKLHTHGMQSFDTFLGPQLDRMFEDLERPAREGIYRLHYVNAREAFNLVKAIEAGHNGDPNDFRNFAVPPPVNRHVSCNAAYEAKEFGSSRILLSVDAAHPDTRIVLGSPAALSIEGESIASVDCVLRDGGIETLVVDGTGTGRVRIPDRHTGALKEKSVSLPLRMTLGAG